MTAPTKSANALALAAIALWSSLAWLGVRLAAMPPFLLVGTALTIAGVLASPTWRQWRVPLPVFALGIYGLFGFHFFLFVALRLAPPLQANLVNYLWPLLMVLLAPVLIPGTRLTRWHVIGAVLGFIGAVVAITDGRLPDRHALGGSEAAWGYAAALLSAFIWATYSLMSRRLRQAGLAFPTPAIGLFCLSSGIAALACHALLEARYDFTKADVLPMTALAIGPMGAAFFLWDAALVRGDARTIATLAYLTPVLSTMLLGAADPSRFGWPIVAALLLVVGGAWLGTRRRTP
jgi:drug/metabolite transporter (DMT)-like permease